MTQSTLPFTLAPKSFILSPIRRTIKRLSGRSGVGEREFALGGSLQRMALRFTQALIAQMVQTGACNRHHTLEQQLCRWLLLTLDRLPGNQVAMTQQLIANMLGVRRAGVTEATTNLQKTGSIRYSGGHILVLNRAKLEKRACECYGVVKKEIKRLFAFERPVRPPVTLKLVSSDR